MPAGILRIDLHLPGIQSLKEKRAIILRLKAGLRRKFNVSAAELENQDLHQRAMLGVATVGASREVVESEMRRALQFLDAQNDCRVIESETELIP